MRAFVLAALSGVSACATAPCQNISAEAARQIGAAALETPEPNGPNMHVIDRGRRWLVGEWIDDLSTDDEVLLGFGGRSVEVDKCSGQPSRRRSWR